MSRSLAVGERSGGLALDRLSPKPYLPSKRMMNRKLDIEPGIQGNSLGKR